MSEAIRTKQHDFYVYVDTVVFTIDPDRHADPRDRLEVLVMKRPERRGDKWALPGGLVADGEKLEFAAVRKVAEETGLEVNLRHLHQVGAFGDPDRDDRYRAISIAYMALMPHPGELRPTRNSEHAEFVPYRRLRERKLLEFDHSDIILRARQVAHTMLEDTDIALKFCRPRFTITDLRGVYEAFLQTRVDPANFRRKVEAVDGLIIPLDEYADFGHSPGRPAQLYRVGNLRRLPTPIRFRSSED